MSADATVFWIGAFVIVLIILGTIAAGMSWAWMHEALAEEPRIGPAIHELEDDEQRVADAARRARIARLDDYRLRGGPVMVDADDEDSVREAMANIEHLR